MAQRRRRPVAAGTLFLDSEGLSKAAAGNHAVRAHLTVASRRGARVVISALSLTETLRGGPRDALLHRVLAGITVVPVSRDVAAEAGRLLGSLATRNDATVDAVVAITAEQQSPPVVLLTSDPVDMGVLTERSSAVTAVEHV